MPATGRELRELISKTVSELIIQNYASIVNALGYDPNIQGHQSTIAEGSSQVGIDDSDTLLIYGSELQAASSEKIEELALAFEAASSDDMTLLTTDYENILFVDAGITISIPSFGDLNIGQYIGLNLTQDVIDLDKAREILDTELNELIPNLKTQEQKIKDFFTSWDALKGNIPAFDLDNDTFVDEDFNSDTYATGHDYTQQSDDYSGYIVRLADGSGMTMQDLRDELIEYLRDIDEAIEPIIVEERPKYENKSPGYIKFRNLNQGIIIRKQEGTDVGIEEPVINSICIDPGPSYLCAGFTITMWVRFLDKVNTGTLFNFGNPTRDIDPKGFKLETFVIDKDEFMQDNTTTWGTHATTYAPDTFANNDKARFVRLVVRDYRDASDMLIYDSHIGLTGQARVATHLDGVIPDFGNAKEHLLLNYTQIPIDFDEWYFIVASYNPVNTETIGVADNTPAYWLGYMSDESTYVSSPSGAGAKCKIEVISKSALLRARGYAPE